MPYFLLIIGAIGLLGGGVFVLVWRSEIAGRLRQSLLLTGGSAIGFPVGVVLHNLLYALAVLSEPIAVLHYLFEVLHAIFFLIATIVCPLGFIIGLLASIVEILKRPPKP